MFKNLFKRVRDFIKYELNAAWIDFLTRNRSKKVMIDGDWHPCTRKTSMRRMSGKGNLLWRVNAVFLGRNTTFAHQSYISCVYRVGLFDYREIKEIAYPPFKDCPLEFLQEADHLINLDWRLEVVARHEINQPHENPKTTLRLHKAVTPHLTSSVSRLHFEVPALLRGKA
jgi:hypothetical protein